MAQPLIRRLSTLTLCDSCAARLTHTLPIIITPTRPLSTTSRHNIDPRSPRQPPEAGATPRGTGMGTLPKAFDDTPRAHSLVLDSMFGPGSFTVPSASNPDALRPLTHLEQTLPKTYHLHVLATKHNTHITLTRPDRSPMLSLSTGNLSFRKANRGTYDAAYQLANYFLGRVQEQGWMKDIEYSEVVLRGFGVGREAVVKCLMGAEGRAFRGTVVRVGDHTRLKFGGTRGEKPRRLG